MKHAHLARIFAALVISAWTLLSQVNTATVTGSISDASHARVPNATLQLRNDATGIKLAAASNSAGLFAFSFVPVGVYVLTVEQPGFQDYSRRGLDLTAGSALSLDIQLQLGASKQEVSVQSETPLISLSSSEDHATLSSRQIAELPLAKQDWTNLLKLQTGIIKSGNQGVAMNGLPPSGFNVTVDGTNASPDAELPSLGFYQGFNVINIMSQEAIQEVSSTKGIAPATVAGSMSGNINIISKGGTNQFHGSLFEFNSVAAFNARNQFLAAKPGSTFNQFGGTAACPVADHDVRTAFVPVGGIGAQFKFL